MSSARGNPPIIRPAVPPDARGIAEVHVAAWRAAYHGLMPQAVLDGLTAEKRASQWLHSINEPGPGVTLVAVSDETVEGFCAFGPSRDHDAADAPVGELAAIYVIPGSWGRGLGRMLCERFLNEADARGWRSATLWVLRDNQPARRFYERMGFTPDGAEKIDTRLIKAPLHEVRYRKAVG